MYSQSIVLNYRIVSMVFTECVFIKISKGNKVSYVIQGYL